MSNQSGIRASPALVSAFNQLLDNGQRAIVAKIVDEACEPAHVISGTNDADADFALVAAVLDPSDAHYILYRTGADTLAFVSFVPMDAKVRAKMLYASSASTIQRQLGGADRFRDVVFWTQLDEVSADGWKAHTRHVDASDPYTTEEQALQLVLENEADQRMGTAGRRSHVGAGGGAASGGAGSGSGGGSSAVGFVLDDSARAVLEQLASHSSGPVAVSLRIDLASETVVAFKPPHDQPHDPHSVAHTYIDNVSPQYTIAGPSPDALVFVYTCPTKSKVRERLVYATNRTALVNQCASVHGLRFAHTLEGTDGPDLADDLVQCYGLAEAKPQTSAPPPAMRFSRPKRPGRG